MRIFNINKGVKGSKTMYNHSIRMKYMIKEEAKRKAKILTFWSKHGLAPTMEAFDIKRSTLFLWKKKMKESGNNLISLNNKSRAPINKRRRVVGEVVKDLIIQIRTEHKRLGKEKLKIILENEHKVILSVPKVGRILKDLREKNLLPRYIKTSMYAKSGKVIERSTVKTKKKRLKKYVSGYVGDVVQVDTVVRFINGVKRYTTTGVDIHGRFGFALTYANHSSKSAADFINKLVEVSPFTITKIQTDNGSEFMYLFDDTLRKHKIEHFHTYPRCPKMNAYIERFNRTLNEEFLRENRLLCADNLPLFNQKLIDYLVWYNTRRPHHSLNLLSPMQFMLKLGKSNMWWTGTFI
jgi:putative transposase